MIHLMLHRSVPRRALMAGLLIPITLLLPLAGTCVRAAEDVDFASEIAPLLESRCLRCHKSGNAEGDVSLETSAALLDGGYILPGQPDASPLMDLITPPDAAARPEMPQEGEPLGSADLDLFRRWIEQSAPWPADVVLRERSAADGSWWSLQPLNVVDPPATTEWSSHPVDRFVLARLEEEGLSPSPPADKRTLLRRATYDLLGLPPSPAEVEAFLADDSEQSYERLIDRLLASPHYGEHWGRHWLDVVRFGESGGFERNEIIDDAWPFRDYVIRSFNDDKPFDCLVREHLAGDVIGPDVPDIEVGTTFLVCGPFDDVGNQDLVQAAQIRANTIDEIIRSSAEAFLGMTVGCARCHDHKFDPILQQDYYAWYATFAGVRHGRRQVATRAQRDEVSQRLTPLISERAELSQRIADLETHVVERTATEADAWTERWSREPIARTGVEDVFAPIEAQHVRLNVGGTESSPTGRTNYRIDEFEVWTAGADSRNVALAANGGQAAGESRTADDFAEAYRADLTIDGQFGERWVAAGPTLTITLAHPELVNRVLFSSDRLGEAGANGVAAFVAEYQIEVSLDGEAWTTVASSEDRQPSTEAHRRARLIQLSINDKERAQRHEWQRRLRDIQRDMSGIMPLPSWWVGEFQEAPGPFHVFVGGDPQKPAGEVLPASLKVLDQRAPGYELPADAPEASRRLALADWIVSSDNPLTPRVLANRVWQYHFGTGLVDTPSDFGSMGGQPSHRQLLDWLAAQVHESGWRLKPLHRLIMLSQTYQQSSRYRPTAAMIDADSRLLWRFPPRRLTGEEVRDTLLLVSGQLDTTMGGPGFRLYKYLQDNVATYVPLDRHGPETYRRAVYHQNARASRIDLMTDFDCPDNSFAAPRRASTTTPLQALTLMNHSLPIDLAEALAERITAEGGDRNVADGIRRAYLLVYSREPDEGEQTDAQTIVSAHGWRALCRALLNSNEFLYLD